MKRKFFWVAIVLLSVVATVVFAAGKGEQPVKGTVINTNIASGPIAGALYPIAGGISAIVGEHDTINMTVQVTAGIVENARLVGTGQVDFAMVSADRAHNAIMNTETFAGENLKMEALGTLHPTVVQIVTLKGKGIKTFEDLVGKRIAIGEPGGGAETQFINLVELSGHTMKDFSTSFMTYDQSIDHLSDNLIDASVIVAGVPAPAIIQLSTKRDVAMVSISDELAKKVMDASPTRIVEPFPADSIPGVSEVFTAVTDRIQFTCRVGLDEEVVYRVTKALYNNLPELIPYHASAKYIFFEQAAKTAIPLHKGAERFYREVGLIK